ncbi:MAG: FAD-binding oxidoreductase, partial [Methylococcales bacterium]|nr:FAD-binding oxidoreductase [Methylococcales bacterium]
MPLLPKLKDIVGEQYLLPADEAQSYLEEQRSKFDSDTLAVVRPATTLEVSAVVKLCAQYQTSIVPQGGNTGLCGGATSTAKQIILSLDRLNKIRHIDTANFTITVDAGCILATVQSAAEQADRFFPLSLGAEGSCQIGGNLSTNAGGINVLRYGSTRDLALGLEVVLADGRIWDGLTALRKNNTGYDLKNLFIGAEGTLGIITAACLKLYPKPVDAVTALIAMPDLPSVIELFSSLRQASSDRISTFELIPRLAVELTSTHFPEHSDPFNTAYPWYILVVL